MLRSSKDFLNTEDGAITVDWVVLTAVVIGVLFGSLTIFGGATVDHAELASQAMEDRTISEIFE